MIQKLALHKHNFSTAVSTAINNETENLIVIGIMGG